MNILHATTQKQLAKIDAFASDNGILANDYQYAGLQCFAEAIG